MPGLQRSVTEWLASTSVSSLLGGMGCITRSYLSVNASTKGIHLTCSKIACNAQQSLVCEESLINGDWHISFNSTFLNQTKILMETQLGSLALCLCPVHYFMNFYSQYYGFSGYFPGFWLIFFLSSVDPASNHFPGPLHVSLFNGHNSSAAPVILFTRLCPFCTTCFYSHFCNLIFYR